MGQRFLLLNIAKHLRGIILEIIFAVNLKQKTMNYFEEVIYAEIVNAEIAYRNGESPISDEKFDKLVEDLKAINPNHKYFIQQFTIEGGDQKQKLPFDMRSLDKVKSIGEFKRWLAKRCIGENDYVVLSPKYDGLSILYNTETGGAWTRGGSDNMGFRRDCHLGLAENLCEETNVFKYVGGEILISRYNWSESFDGKTNMRSGEPYKTPRGTVAGLINSPDADYRMKKASFVPYVNLEDDFTEDYDVTMGKLSSMNPFGYGMCACVKVKKITEDMLKEMFAYWSEKCEIDGVVISVNNAEKRKQLGRDENTLNPNYSVAFKGIFDVEYSTKVVDVNVKVSKNGYLRPTVEIEPIYIDGVKIDNPTGNNMGFVCDNHLAKGTEVKVIRSGSVIPKIVHSGKYCQEEFNDLMDRLTECPSCGSPTCWNNSYTDLVCTYFECPGIKLAKIVYFFDCFGFEEFGENTIKILFEAGYDSIKKILDAEITELIKIDGIGSSVANSLALQTYTLKSSEISMAKLMQASDVFEGIGEKKAELICGYLTENNILPELAKLEDLVKIKGVGDAVAYSYINGFPKFMRWIKDNQLMYSEVKKQAPTGSSMVGQSVCFSGVRDKTLEQQIVANGGKIASTVSGKTTMLVVKDPNESTSKIEKAKTLGIKIVSLDEVLQLVK